MADDARTTGTETDLGRYYETIAKRRASRSTEVPPSAGRNNTQNNGPILRLGVVAWLVIALGFWIFTWMLLWQLNQKATIDPPFVGKVTLWGPFLVALHLGER
jgi:hypothetical protein